MRTTRITISKPFMEGGLNPYPGSLNNNFLNICKNASISKASGMSGYIPELKSILDEDVSFIDSVSGDPITITNRWPFPQLFLTDVGLHIGALEGLYFLDHYHSTPTKFVLYSYATGAVTWPWSCAEIDQRPAFTSGDVLVYYDAISETYKKVTYA
jgi:hypothetical protein